MITNQILVSIIIPTYNRAHLIGQTLDSVLAQTHSNWECIVVDDGSTDDTDVKVKSYCDKDSRFQFHKRPETHLPGGNGARNYGYVLSNGEFIQWFDSDDIMLPEYLNENIKIFEDSLSMVMCNGYYVSEGLENKQEIKSILTDRLYDDYVKNYIPIYIPSVLFSKRYLKNKRLFDENLTRGQEAELFSRFFFHLKKTDYKILNRYLFLYRQHSETKTNDNRKYNKKHKLSQAKFFMRNIDLCISKGNDTLVSYLYKQMLKCFTLALMNKDTKTVNYILDKIRSGNLINCTLKFFELKIYFWLTNYFNINSYNLYQHIKSGGYFNKV